MKTYQEIEYVNYQEISFLRGVSMIEAKNIISNCLEIEKPKIKDAVAIFKAEKYLRSHDDRYDGKGVMQVVVEHYNRGLTSLELQKFANNRAFIGALSFKGRHSILNAILNPDDLLSLQKEWLLKLCDSGKNLVSLKARKNLANFVNDNLWALPFLQENKLEPNFKHIAQ